MGEPPLVPARGTARIGILCSFHYYRDVDLRDYLARMTYRPPLFTDSGGFSAASIGAKVDLGEYGAWLTRYRREITMFANFDVIGDPVATRRNQLAMELRGHRPLPVVHFGSSLDELRRYADRGHTYACLGGLVPHMKDLSRAIAGGQPHPVLAWLDEGHRVASEVGVALHGFGVTNWEVLKRYPWTSVDSSSWASGYRYGSFRVFDPLARGGLGAWREVRLRDPSSVMSASRLIYGLGFQAATLVRDQADLVQRIIEISARTWAVAAEWLVARRRAAGDTTPLTIHLVDAALPHLVSAMNALHGWSPTS